MITKIVALIICGILILAWVVTVIPYLVIMPFFKIEFMRKFYCKIMSWHSKSYDDVHKDPKDPLQFLDFAKCKWCGYEGQVDSQGNLF